MSSPGPTSGRGDRPTAQSTAPAPARPRVPTAWLFVAALALAAGVRLYGLGEEDYWLDELHSLANSAARRAAFEALPHGEIIESAPRFTDLNDQSTVSAVWRGMEVDSHPPTYFVALLAWRRLVGDGEAAVRSLPVFFSLLSIVPAALILREHGRMRLGVLLAGMLAVTFSHIHVAQENRPYSLGLLFVSVSYLALARLHGRWRGRVDRDAWAWLAIYALCVYAAMMTHYFTGLALLGQAVFVAWRGRGSFRTAWAGAVTMAAVAFLATWGRQLYGQLDFIGHQEWLLEQTPDHAWRTILRFADLPVRVLVTHERFRLHIAVSLIGAVLLAGSLWSVWKASATDRQGADAAALFALWYIVPAIVFTIVDLTTSKQLLAHVRYPSIAAPGLVGLLVLGAAPLHRTVRWGLAGGFFLGVLLTLSLPAQVNPDGSRAARLIAERAAPGDLVVYDAIAWPPVWASTLYHTVSNHLPAEQRLVRPPFVLLREPPTEALRQAMATFNRIIVVSPRLERNINPVPGRFVEAGKTGYVRQIGWIYLFDRVTPPPGT